MAEVIINYIDSKNGEYTESNEDMWDYESEYEEEEEEDEDDYYEDDEVDMTEEELADFLANGGEVEYL
jgi:hypothetical protein